MTRLSVLPALFFLVAASACAAGAPPAAPPALHNRIEVSDQPVRDGAVVIAEVNANQAGFVVVHAAAEGGGPAVPQSIGHAYVPEGTTQSVRVPLSESVAPGARLFAMLHADTDGDRAYAFGPGSTDVDTPVKEGGAVVVVPFAVTDPYPVTPHATAITLLDPSIRYAPRDGTVRVYGAGGPQNAFQEAADLFEAETGTPVEITFGPESSWSADAQRDADVLWGTAEQAMTAFLQTYTEFPSEAVEPLYLREAVIAVQPGNPKDIQGFDDLLRDGVSIVVVEGAGIYNTSGTGVWEDVAARLGSLGDVRRFRENIVAYAQGSGAGFQAFKDGADAWITWSYWPIDHPGEADLVRFEDDRVIWRDVSVVVSPEADPAAAAYVEFLTTPRAVAIFERHGMTR